MEEPIPPCRECKKAGEPGCYSCRKRRDFAKVWEMWADEMIRCYEHLLKCCPFCGNPIKLYHNSIERRFRYACETSGCIMNGLTSDPYMCEYRDLHHLVSDWNERND